MSLDPTSGHVADGVHRFPIRVYYEDTDAGGIVYHANYLRFAERARSECLRVVGWQYDRLLAETGLGWVVRRATIDFRLPARLDDALVVETRLMDMKGARMTARQTVHRGADLLVGLDLELVLLTPAGRPGRIPASLADAIRPFLVSVTAEVSAPEPCKPSTP
ncbi:MAG TPA: tol-pal system-associated acyl-CoA thioesterase [Aliidongia sp.]|uniref:tol-pal system-associated acyl-CoA thioesterase n=1 Tax=Aliidongia sp. TaxID=1914230 RepID=UPI002DDD41A4|nr:tol-pal system-associated acyl-CoA thioesterase [Aliidongia sp.]HEV2676622.1 tol-pal system-associated acyl-CoA thioesterase [Aliidongia sp.]